MDDKQRVKISKFLSLVLRHNPAAANVVLDEHGWASVQALLDGAAAAGRKISHDDLLDVVATSPKQRFALSDDGLRIRASQGHSVSVDLGYEPSVPPNVLYHGTYADVVDLILTDGLKKMNRHHVHLSSDVETATQVGARRGPPVILKIDASAMVDQGYAFFVSANGVWLTDHVPPNFISKI
ncbi:MAG: RNA 2'-phosphotransferase [bacterium]